MSQLPIIDPGVSNADDVRARNLAVFNRRKAEYLKRFAEASAAPPPEESKRPADAVKWAQHWRSVWLEISRQTGIPAEQIKRDDEGRSQPVVAYRQLAIALTHKLTAMPLKAMARIYGLQNHSTILHTKAAMAPIIDAVGLTEEDSVPAWVEACLPLVLVHVAECRARNRKRCTAMARSDGRFRQRETYKGFPPEMKVNGNVPAV
jgi:hypothetical protein